MDLWHQITRLLDDQIENNSSWNLQDKLLWLESASVFSNSMLAGFKNCKNIVGSSKYLNHEENLKFRMFKFENLRSLAITTWFLAEDKQWDNVTIFHTKTREFVIWDAKYEMKRNNN